MKIKGVRMLVKANQTFVYVIDNDAKDDTEKVELTVPELSYLIEQDADRNGDVWLSRDWSNSSVHLSQYGFNKADLIQQALKREREEI
jgi:hypothetical protein